MARRYIDFISAYCDSWCERCAFTERCSSFAVQSALAMCDGNHEAAIELAIGPPRVPGAPAKKKLSERMAEAFAGFDPSEKELDEIGRELDARDRRAERHGAAEASHDYAIAAHRWLHQENRCADSTDPTVKDAVDVISWDCFLIHVKVMRALNGRDEYPAGAPFEQSAIQSDWNGSAKVALLSMQRSEQAWRVVATATNEEAATVLADNLESLRHEVSREFPRAMEFRRPGFDDGARS